jgi:hypothetical protein
MQRKGITWNICTVTLQLVTATGMNKWLHAITVTPDTSGMSHWQPATGNR